MRKNIAVAFVAAASCLSACASPSASNVPAGSHAQFLENFSNPEMGFESQKLTYTCQEDPGFSQLPESVEGIVKDVRTSGTFRIRMSWVLEKDKGAMQVSANATPIKPRNQILDLERLRAIGNEIQAKVGKKCASLSPPPLLPPLPVPSQEAAPLPAGVSVAHLRMETAAARLG